MNLFFLILAVIAILGTFIVMLIGLSAFARGEKVKPKFSNKMMQARVYFQACAIILILIFLLLSSNN